jgi:AraC family transcriptional regulator of adaptative response / DNA-3-methyladenine glycosylase II
VLGQQVSVAGAGTLTARLVGRYGTPTPGLHELGVAARFPAPDDLADADLAGVGLTEARAGAVRAFSRAVADGKVTLDRSRPLGELVESLTAVEGVGPWTAHYLALRMGEPDAFPVTDLGLRRAAGRAIGAAPLSPGDLAARAEVWRPWRALAATYLWTAPATARIAPAEDERAFATMGA